MVTDAQLYYDSEDSLSINECELKVAINIIGYAAEYQDNLICLSLNQIMFL